MIELKKLLVFNFKSFINITYGIIIAAKIERWTNIEFPIRSKCHCCITSSAVIHFIKHHTVCDQI